MNSAIAEAIHMKHQPVAISFRNDRPEKALQFAPGKWGCAMTMLFSAAKGKTAVFDRNTMGCLGGYTGICLGNKYPDFPGGIDKFLSTGSEFREGEFYCKTPEIAQKFVDSLPYQDISETYVIFEPLSAVDPQNPPEIVSLFVNMQQLSGLVVLANYDRGDRNAVEIPFCAGCHSTVLLPYAESKKDEPKAIVGNTDITSRKFFDANLITFTVPWKRFLEMEANVESSFLTKDQWALLQKKFDDGY